MLHLPSDRDGLGYGWLRADGDVAVVDRDQKTKERYAEGQRGTAGAYMRMSVTTLRLLRRAFVLDL